MLFNFLIFVNFFVLLYIFNHKKLDSCNDSFTVNVRYAEISVKTVGVCSDKFVHFAVVPFAKLHRQTAPDVGFPWG